MLLFDIGANRGDATLAGLELGYSVVALEPAPRIFSKLVNNFIYNPNVIPLKLAVAEESGKRLEFYEAVEDGLSTLNKDWLTSDTMPYNGKEFRTIQVNTITLDALIEKYGKPDLVKIDVEGAEWSVFHGLTQNCGTLVFEWTQETLSEHEAQLDYLKGIGYSEFMFQFIENHLQEPETPVWHAIGSESLDTLRKKGEKWWTTSGWRRANLRPTADVGMIWVR
jgi:FkbM family methyltransferase